MPPMMNMARTVATLSAACLLAASGALAQSAPARAPGATSTVVVENDDSISIRMENGKLVSVEHNGKKVPLSRVKQDDGKIVILGDNGMVVYDSALATPPETPAVGVPLWRRGELPPGQVAGVTIDPPKVMIGIQMAPLDRSLAGHFGLSDGQATLVSGVYEGLPASKAGLSTYQIIVAVDGNTPAGQEDIRRVLRNKDKGDRVTFTVIQNGQRRDVSCNVDKYDQDRLSAAKLNAIQTSDAAASWIVPGHEVGGPNTMIFQRSDGGDPIEIQEFRMPDGWQEHIKRYIDHTGDKDHAESLRREILDRVKDLEMRPRQADSGPREVEGVPLGGGRVRDLEKRLERLEEMLQKLLERHEGGGR